MGYKITLTNGIPTMTYEQDNTIGTDLLLSILVRQGAFFLNPKFGLRSLPKKGTDQNVALIGDYFKQATQWLLDADKAKTIDVLAERADNTRDRVNVRITVEQPNDTVVEFETFVEVV